MFRLEISVSETVSVMPNQPSTGLPNFWTIWGGSIAPRPQRWMRCSGTGRPISAFSMKGICTPQVQPCSVTTGQ